MKKFVFAVALAAVVVPLAALSAPASTGPTSQSKAATALVACGKVRTIGISEPITGPAASLGTQQQRWARFYATRYNATHKKKIRLVEGDSQLPNTAEAIKVAEQFASNGKMLGVVGPAGSQEVVASTPPLKNAGLAYVSGSATRTSLTDGSRKGYFFRTVPNDDQQGPRVVNWIRTKIKARRVVVIDDQEAYGQGLSDTVERLLKNGGVTVQRESVDPEHTSDFSSLVARIPSNAQVVYTPWQLPPKVQAFGRQLRSAGKNAVMFGSDGTFAPGVFTIQGSYMSFFPVDLKSNFLNRYKRTHGGKPEFFGLPTYVAVDAVTRAVDKACKNGTASRAEVRRLIAKTNIPKKQSLLGFTTRFFTNDPAGPQGPGDLRNPANFGIYKIGKGGAYTRVS